MGQLVVSAGVVVSGITWYALMGRYDSNWFAVTTSTNYSLNHNIGWPPTQYSAKGATSINGATAADFLMYSNNGPSAGGAWVGQVWFTTMQLITDIAAVRIPASTGTIVTATHARVTASRGW